MSEDNEKCFITPEQAEKMLPEGEEVHTFRNNTFALIGADWGRDELLKHMEKYKDTLQLSGPTATSMDHGIVLIDPHGALFIETKKQSSQEVLPMTAHPLTLAGTEACNPPTSREYGEQAGGNGAN